uniref:Large ribosomal subunit protein uL29m n=1 Tax=Strongyloides papillosus TaxID=174720 RepID=A0A0N5BVZ4_STREA
MLRRTCYLLCSKPTAAVEAASKEGQPAIPPKKTPYAQVYQKLGIFQQFFDIPDNWGVTELTKLNRPGREWSADELRLKSNTDLHKLWYVLLKERNMLLTMKTAFKVGVDHFPNEERIDRVKMSMENIEEVIHERNNAFYELETGLPATPKKRRVTSILGFTYDKQVEEHALPNEITKQKEYEIPYLDDDAYIMQKLWKEKKYYQNIELSNMKVLEEQKTHEQFKHRRGLRKTYNDVSQVKGLRYN